jgi:hypothetical protein
MFALLTYEFNKGTWIQMRAGCGLDNTSQL